MIAQNSRKSKEKRGIWTLDNFYNCRLKHGALSSSTGRSTTRRGGGTHTGTVTVGGFHDFCQGCTCMRHCMCRQARAASRAHYRRPTGNLQAPSAPSEPLNFLLGQVPRLSLSQVPAPVHLPLSTPYSGQPCVLDMITYHSHFPMRGNRLRARPAPWIVRVSLHCHQTR